MAVYEVPVWPEIADPLKYHWFPDVALEFNTEPLCVMVGVVGTAYVVMAVLLVVVLVPLVTVTV